MLRIKAVSQAPKKAENRIRRLELMGGQGNLAGDGERPFYRLKMLIDYL